MKIANLICIGCPLGCSLEARMEGCEVLCVSGHSCSNGESYARTELTAPTRIVTTTVPITGGTLVMLPVRTDAPIPKSKIRDCIREIKALRLTAPVAIGDIVIENVCGTGVSVVAARHIPLL